MKKILVLSFLIVAIQFPAVVWAADNGEIISLYEGSDVIYDDQIGFEEYPLVVGDTEVRVIEGELRRKWISAPENRSPYEIITNYKNAISGSGGEIIYFTRDPRKVEIDGKKLPGHFSRQRRERGLATRVFSYTQFPTTMTEYLVAGIKTAEADYYIVIAAGTGHSAARQQNRTYYELITLKTEPMDMGMVTLDAINEGLAARGGVAIYDIYFDSGESEIKEGSAAALEIIADYLKSNPNKKFLVVGHTDSVGSFTSNLQLATARAEAVKNELVSVHGVNVAQLTPYGVGPASPIVSNQTSAGRARNRRVELVEQ